MEDEQIVALYWARKEQAISASAEKYGAYCQSIAVNILQNQSDAEECVNDTWFRAWGAMPPQRPKILSAFLGKLTRNLSFDRYRALHRHKRGGYEMDLVLDELAECVSGGEDPAARLAAKELGREISRFLAGLPTQKRQIFVLRYWYACPVGRIAERFGLQQGHVSVLLHRLREKLRAHLEKEGYKL